jgi:hypothetical protein
MTTTSTATTTDAVTRGVEDALRRVLGATLPPAHPLIGELIGQVLRTALRQSDGRMHRLPGAREQVSAGAPACFWQGKDGGLTTETADSEGCVSPRYGQVFLHGIGPVVGLEVGHSRFQSSHDPEITGVCLPGWPSREPGHWDAEPGARRHAEGIAAEALRHRARVAMGL